MVKGATTSAEVAHAGRREAAIRSVPRELLRPSFSIPEWSAEAVDLRAARRTVASTSRCFAAGPKERMLYANSLRRNAGLAIRAAGQTALTLSWCARRSEFMDRAARQATAAVAC